MSTLDNIQPKKVFEYFKAISAIPRGSGNEKAVSDYIKNFALALGLEAYQDEMANLVIRKPATVGYETKKGVILQSHLDMVCVKEDDVTHNFEVEGIELEVNGDRMTAKGTTLGADNGIGVAMIMAILAADDIAHPPLEALLTAHEEDSMMGAVKFDHTLFSGTRLINLDTEEEGELIAGSAGVGRVDLVLPISQNPSTYKHFVTLNISGLKGGHSGIKIDDERGNAIMLLAELLVKLEGKIELAEITGGSLMNVIPSTAKATLACKDIDSVKAVAQAFEVAVKQRQPDMAKELSVSVAQAKPKDVVFDKKTTDAVISIVLLTPCGVLTRDTQLKSILCSNNLANIKRKGDKLIVELMQRGAHKSYFELFLAQIKQIAKNTGAQVVPTDYIPGWEYEPNSPFRDLVLATHQKLFNKPCKVSLIHAGLECGMIKAKLGDIEVLSIGPDITGAHSTKEDVSVSSVARIYRWVLEILKQA